MVLVLYEGPIGYCLFKLTDAGFLSKADQHKTLSDSTQASNLLKLQSIHRFQNTADAVEDITAISDGKISKSLKKFLVDEITGGKKKKQKEEQLVVSDPKLGECVCVRHERTMCERANYV